jgi:tRNA(Arg) A34 adenosine deaminase TadA
MHHPDVAVPLVTSRRHFVRAVSLAATKSSIFCAAQFAHAAVVASESPTNSAGSPDAAFDVARMRSLAAWTALTLQTPHPVPYGAEIVHTESGERLMRATNAVGEQHDPSAHAEVRTIRLACRTLKSPSLRGYTLYTTCEPCPMCMACALWARMDRVVYGATISDAARFGHQIQIPATEVVKRSDMKCVVDGPIERDACFALFTDPNMQKTFKIWKSEKP